MSLWLACSSVFNVDFEHAIAKTYVLDAYKIFIFFFQVFKRMFALHYVKSHLNDLKLFRLFS